MGCGTSQPVVTQDQHTPSTQLPNKTLNPPEPQKTSQKNIQTQGSANGLSTLPSVEKHESGSMVRYESGSMVRYESGLLTEGDTGSSRNTPPRQRRKAPASKRSLIEDELPERRSDYGPKRDYEGLRLVKIENDRLTHIVTLATSIMKAGLCFVVLGQKDKMVLAKTCGIDEEDDVWLPSACAWSLKQDPGLLVISNMTLDERTNDLNWVKQDPEACFYAGAPICSTTGERLGCLCVLDFEPRESMMMICQSLINLAEMIAREVVAEEQMNSGEVLLNRAIDTYWDACLYLDISDKWTIKYCNDAFVTLTALERDKVIGTNMWDIIELSGSAVPQDADGKMREVLKKHQTHDVQPIVFLVGKQAVVGSLASRKVTYKINMRPMRAMHIQNYSLPFGEDEIRHLWFGVISAFQLDNSRGQFSIELDVSLIPFDGVEMGPIIGKGSFGSVFKATWSGRVVAIKIIPFSEIAKVDAGGNPLEASLMLDMKHPNIVETFQHALQASAQPKAPDDEGASAKHTSAGSAASASSNLQFWLMLEFCDVGTLSDGLNIGLLHDTIDDGSGTVAVPKVSFVLETLRDIARGMEYVHSFNILHSDLTAGNVLLDSTDAGIQGKRNFVAKIADFGLSRQALTTKVETNTYGTVTHMPPELLNEGIVSKSADVYAFGVLVYEVYTRKPVWEGLRHPQIIHAIAVQKKHPQIPDSAPQAIRELANACMAADPTGRPTFTEIIARIDKIL